MARQGSPQMAPNGNYVVGWVNEPPMFAEGWIVNLDDLILGTAAFSQNQVSFYPNPVKDILNINSAKTIDLVEIYNITGQKVSAISNFGNNKQINLSSLSSGVYLVKVAGDNFSETIKIVKE